MNKGSYGFPLGRNRRVRPYHRTRVEKTLTNQVIATGTWTQITYDSIAHDDDGMWNVNLSGQLTVYTPGVWAAEAGTSESAPLSENDETHILAIYKNGINGKRIGSKGNGRMFSGTTLNAFGSDRFNVGDYITAYFYVDGGTTLAAQPNVHLSAEWVSP